MIRCPLYRPSDRQSRFSGTLWQSGLKNSLDRFSVSSPNFWLLKNLTVIEQIVSQTATVLCRTFGFYCYATCIHAYITTKDGG